MNDFDVRGITPAPPAPRYIEYAGLVVSKPVMVGLGIFCAAGIVYGPQAILSACGRVITNTIVPILKHKATETFVLATGALVGTWEAAQLYYQYKNSPQGNLQQVHLQQNQVNRGPDIPGAVTPDGYITMPTG